MLSLGIPTQNPKTTSTSLHQVLVICPDQQPHHRWHELRLAEARGEAFLAPSDTAVAGRQLAL